MSVIYLVVSISAYATSRGVSESLFSEFTSAPFFINSSTNSERPRKAAVCRAVPPSLFLEFIPTPLSIRIDAASMYPCMATQDKRVIPNSLSRILSNSTLPAPFSNRFLRESISPFLASSIIPPSLGVFIPFAIPANILTHVIAGMTVTKDKSRGIPIRFKRCFTKRLNPLLRHNIAVKNPLKRKNTGILNPCIAETMSPNPSHLFESWIGQIGTSK